MTNRLSALLSDADLMADRGRLAMIDERLAAVVAALNAECAALSDNFTACAEMSGSTWPQLLAEPDVHQRVANLYALHVERADLTERRADLARVILPRARL